MYIFSKNLMLQTTSEINKQAFASAEALQAMLQVGDAIKINDGTGEDIYRYTAYPINTTKSGKFTYTSNILKIQEKAGKTIYYCNFNVPTNEVSLSGSVHFSAYKNNNTILYVAPNEKDGVVYDSSLTALNPQPTFEVATLLNYTAQLDALDPTLINGTGTISLEGLKTSGSIWTSNELSSQQSYGYVYTGYRNINKSTNCGIVPVFEIPVN